MRKTRNKTTNNKLVFAANELSALLSRQEMLRSGNPDPRRDLDLECGYPKVMRPADFIDLFNKDGMANRIVSSYPDECFGVDPEIYETEDPAITAFEMKWQELCETQYTNPIHYLHRLDLESRKGRFGALLFGFDDTDDFSKPAPGLDENGLTIPTKEVNLLYLRAFNEGSIYIKTVEPKKSSPRFGLPTSYSINLVDDYTSTNGVTEIGNRSDMVVHWTRIQHAVDGAQCGEVLGLPALNYNYRRILDLQKLLGSSAEMFYKGGFPGLSVELDPRVLELQNIDFDFADVTANTQKYMDGLQRVLMLVGFNAKSLAPQVANPEGHLQAQLQVLAAGIGMPLRILMGSEAGQVAGAQDVKNWNHRVHRRQHKYLTPMVLRPFVDRLVSVGVLPSPLLGPKAYKIFWPDVNLPDENEQSQIADRQAAAIMKYVMSGAYLIMQPSHFFRYILRMPIDQVDLIMEKLKQTPEVDLKKLLEVAGKGPADSGSKGSPPSDPPKGGVIK